MISFCRYLWVGRRDCSLWMEQNGEAMTKPLPFFPPLFRSAIRTSAKAIAATSFFIALSTYFVFLDKSLIYVTPSFRGWTYLVLSPVLVLLVHDCFHYWMHRTSHRWGWYYRNFHIVHHKYKRAIPYSDWAMHPVDAAMNLLFMVVVPYIIPMHAVVYFAYLAFASAANAWGHAGREVMPRYFVSARSWLAHYTVHNGHHRFPNTNFSFYLTIWDKMCGTFYYAPELKNEAEREKDEYLEKLRQAS